MKYVTSARNRAAVGDGTPRRPEGSVPSEPETELSTKSF
jgi:hypothetical protein